MGEEKNCPSVLGLTLQLQKYSVGNNTHNSTAQFRVMGHYDGLLIRKIQKWFDYSPRKDWEQVGNEGNSGEDLANHYPIKLLFPGLEQSVEFPPLYYDDWENYETLLEKYPCMTLVLVNLTNAYRCQDISNLLPSFLRLLKKSCDTTILIKTHCCVLPSLGYSDFCILMADDNWTSALNLVEYLHGLRTDNNLAVLSTDYMMPVLCNPKFEQAEKYFEGITLAVRIHLRPGMMTKQLNLPDGIMAYRPSGGSDCLLHAESPTDQARLLQFLLESETSNIVIDVTSTLRLPLLAPTKPPSLPSNPEKPSSPEEHSLSFIDTFKTDIKAYKEKLVGKRRHLRQVNALLELCSSIEGICNQPHTGDLRRIMQDLINNFSDCLRRCTIGMDTRGWPFEEMELSIGTLCDIISSFISDLSRSDCFYIERERYNHASVGSATSLLLAYNIWLNDFTDAVRAATGQSEESDHSFLVTSGGQDRTQTYNAFDFLEPDEKNGKICEKVPLITQMAEMSLFDFSGTVLRSVHECMHFCGIRLRERRLTYLIDFVATSFARTIATVLFTEKSELEYAKSVCQALGSVTQAAVLEEKIRSPFVKCQCALQEKVKCFLMEYLSIEPDSFTKEKDYLIKNVQDWMYDNLIKAFSGYTLERKQGEAAVLAPCYFAAQLHNAVRKAFIDFRNSCDTLFITEGIDTSVFAFESNKYKMYDQRGIDDPVISRAVQLVLSRILITTPPASLPKEDSGEDYRMWEGSVPYIALSRGNLAYKLQIAADIFSETFADIMACRILKAGIEDYLLMHVYEDWDPDFSLELEMANEYRIPAVLRLCFRNSLDTKQCSLTEACKKSVADAIECLEAHGIPKERLNAREICTRVDELLQKYKQNEAVAQPLMDYLQACLNEYTELGVWNKLQKYANSFKKIRLLSIKPNSEDVNKRLVNMYYALIHRRGGKDGGKTTCVQQMAETMQPV